MTKKKKKKPVKSSLVRILPSVSTQGTDNVKLHIIVKFTHKPHKYIT